MKNKTHLAERYCRKILSEFPNAIERTQELRIKKASYGDIWPDWCNLPLSVVNEILGIHFDRMYNSPSYSSPKVLDLAAALIWQHSKMIYAFDSDLSGSLLNQTFDGSIPIQVFEFLPYDCVYIELKTRVNNSDASGFFAWINWNTEMMSRELYLSLLMNTGETIGYVIPLIGILAESRDALHDNVSRKIRNNQNIEAHNRTIHL